MEAGREVESRQPPYESGLRPPLPALKNNYNVRKTITKLLFARNSVIYDFRQIAE